LNIKLQRGTSNNNKKSKNYFSKRVDFVYIDIGKEKKQKKHLKNNEKLQMVKAPFSIKMSTLANFQSF